MRDWGLQEFERFPVDERVDVASYALLGSMQSLRLLGERLDACSETRIPAFENRSHGARGVVDPYSGYCTAIMLEGGLPGKGYPSDFGNSTA